MKGHVDIIFVYIVEAHAIDEWPISSGRYNRGRGPVSVSQPTSNEERLALANKFRSDFDCLEIPMLVDPIQNEFEKKYAPWPLRFYGVDENGKMSYIANPKDCTFDPLEVWQWCLSKK